MSNVERRSQDRFQATVSLFPSSFDIRCSTFDILYGHRLPAERPDALPCTFRGPPFGGRPDRSPAPALSEAEWGDLREPWGNRATPLKSPLKGAILAVPWLVARPVV